MSNIKVNESKEIDSKIHNFIQNLVKDTDIATIMQQYHTEEPAKVVGMVYKYLNIQRALWFACGFVLGFILLALITMEVVL